ncbi:hypothetical protein ACFVT5_40940 [Streptomyces sp. NPDC058001]|uniref:hypothetical protein n=1 Tax=Streptomyces sp. NPDC058001 TaxID=3346300 RepID=UPI0036E2AC27
MTTAACQHTQEAMPTAAKPLPPHGTLSRHKYHKCKCHECVDNYRAYQRNRHRKQGYGTWQPLVDAEPIRQHLLRLREQGIAFTRVAEIAGLHPPTVGAFLYGLGPKRPRKKRATPEIAAKILAVTAETATPNIVNSTGTRRRIQALAVNGWPMKALGPHIGVNPATVCRLALQARVFRATAEAVAACYLKLAGENPEAHGISASVAERSRRHAAREGWHDPLWWEDMGRIDDPDFDPAAADREPGARELAALRREEIEHLAWCGHTPEQIRARLDNEVSISTVRQIVHEWRTGEKRQRKQVAA